MERSNYLEVLRCLEEHYGKDILWKEAQEILEKQDMSFLLRDIRDPFKNLVITILSQNTSDKNSTRAYIDLVKRFGDVTPEILLNAKKSAICAAIKRGGLYNIKAKMLKQLAEIVLTDFKGDASQLTKLSRKELKEIPGIGNKTADVFLSCCAGRDTVPIDTNVDRVVKRLGLVQKNAGYEEMSAILNKYTPSNKCQRVHQMLVRLGRDFCKPRKPNCDLCPVAEFCEGI